MKVFISWSGGTSKAVALALRSWIPDVLQAVKPWISEADIWAGARWGREVERELSESRFGIICLTRANQAAPWVLFEAGALAKTLEDTYVCPYLLDLEPADLASGPLTQFQAKRADQPGTWDLIQALNRCLGAEALPEDRLQRMFDRCWPDLQEILEAPREQADVGARRPQEEMNAEVLELVRGIARATSASPSLEALERVQSGLDFLRTANTAILSVLKLQKEDLDQVVGGSEPSFILVDLGLDEGDEVIPVEVRPRHTVYDTLSSVWAAMQDQSFPPPAFTYLWTWLMVRSSDQFALVMTGWVTRTVFARTVFKADEMWRVVRLEEPLIRNMEELGVIRGVPWPLG